MRILIFGIGRYYQKQKKALIERLEDDEIVGFLDNKVKFESEFENKRLCNPSMINEILFDIVLIMSSYIREIKEQLLNLGVNLGKIKFLDQYIAEKTRGEMIIYNNTLPAANKGKSILIITHRIEYSGAPMTAIYAATVLKEKGYNVWLAAPTAEQQFIKEIKTMGINLAICPAINYLNREELFFINKFDVILVNTFALIRVASIISLEKPVLWWIHEADSMYNRYIQQYADYNEEYKLKKINVVAVSKIAKKNFELHCLKKINQLMHFGIPDESAKNFNPKDKNKVIFAIIGGINERKAQKIFVEAIKLIPQVYLKLAEFWIIGYSNDSKYYIEVKDMAKDISQIKFTGSMTRKNLHQAFKSIDVVVCASLEEPFSITIVEGFMFSKICITTDTTAVANYIEQGKNGFICKANDVNDLSEKMKWCIDDDNKLKLIEIGKNARKTYEEFFTMEKFGERLENIILQTEKNYEKF